MKLNRIIISASLIASVAILWTACKKDEQNVAPPDPENEVITTVKLVATNNADLTDISTATWKDLTPADGNPDTSNATLKLKKDAVYTVAVLFTDETKSPVGDITAEVIERSNYHLICYEPSAGLNLTVVRTDKDNNSPALELGQKARFTTGAASTGRLNVSLHHQPSGKNGIDCSIGSTDADVNFSVKVE